MDVHDLVRALLRGDLLHARQLVADARRADCQWDLLPQPVGLSEQELAVAAALIEMLAMRGHTEPPAWTAAVGPLDGLLVLDPGLEQMPRSFARAKLSGPEPLRRRNIVVLPGFLEVA
jgi:hypothetical protein